MGRARESAGKHWIFSKWLPDRLRKNGFNDSKKPRAKKRAAGEPGGVRITDKKRMSAEAEAGAEAEDARRQDLQHVIAVGPADDHLPLQDVRFVERVEHVHAQGEAEVTNGKILFDPQVDQVGVRQLVTAGAGLHRDVERQS